MITELIHTYSGHKDSIYKLIKLNDEEFLSLSGDGNIVKWDINRPEKAGIAMAKLPVVIYSAKYIVEKNQLWVGTRFGSVYVLDLNDNKVLKHLELEGDVFSMGRLGNWMYSVDAKGNLTQFDVDTLEMVRSIKISENSGRTLCFDEKNERIYSGWSDSYIRVFNLESELIKEFKAHETSVFSLVLGADGKYLYSGGKDARIRVWDLKNNTEISALNAHWYAIYNLDFTEIYQLMSSTSRDKTAKIWEIDDNGIPILKSVLRPLTEGGHTHSVNTSMWFDNPRRLVTAGDDRIIRVWEVC
jgi:WD40 repeat protein